MQSRQIVLTLTGVLFRLDSDGTLHRMLENVKIPNGMSWSADDKVMYFTDSPKKCIEAFDFDAESGSISNPQTVYQYEGEGVPDGHCQDENGNLWVAICEGGKVLQVSPTGKLLAQITLPTTMPTCPVFCGTSLFITSGQEQDPDNHPESAAVSGSLFSIDVGVRGQKVSPENRLSGSRPRNEPPVSVFESKIARSQVLNLEAYAS